MHDLILLEGSEGCSNPIRIPAFHMEIRSNNWTQINKRSLCSII